MNLSLLSNTSVHSLPILAFAMIPNIYRHISAFFVLVMTAFIILSRMYGFRLLWNYGFFDDLNTFLQSFSKVGSSDFIAFSRILKKSSGERC